jgi:peptide deformylase
MATRNIIKEGAPILYKKCRPVEKFDENLSILIDDMFETMKCGRGVGLAAPQVGILKRIFVVNSGDGDIELVNPVIVETSGEQKGDEGCLSCPGQFAAVIRPMFVTIKGQNREGEEVRYVGRALKARAFCHEFDHLEGILFKSRAV